MRRTFLAAGVALLCGLLPFALRANDLGNSSWSEIDSSNNQAAPNGWTSGVMTPNQVEPTARASAGALKRWYNHIQPTITSGGAANVQTLTYTQAPAAYVTGDVYTFIAGYTNTGATTLNVNSLGAKAVQLNGAALSGTEIVVNRAIEVYYDGTQFQIKGGISAATRYGIGPNNACNPVTDFAADATGGADVASAINSCASVQKNGQHVNVYVPGGSYRLNDNITLSAGQCLYGDGVGITTLTVDQTFSSSADSVIKLLNQEKSSPCVHDLSIEFAQPSDQGTRSNFKTLAAGCTSGTGGTGCKYPPAIYMPASTGGNRSLLWNLLIERAWNAIDDEAAGGFFFRNLQVSALNKGLIMANGLDVGYIDDFHFWPFGIDSSTALYSGVWGDGNTFAADFGEVDGIHVNGFTSVTGRVAINSSFSWGTFTDLKIDGATLEIAHTGGPGLQIQGVYATGTASGANTNCQITVSSGLVQITNITTSSAGTGDPGTSLCVTGSSAKVTVTGGSTVSNDTTSRSIKQTDGRLSVVGVTFQANTGAGAYTVPLVDIQDGGINFNTNSFLTPAGTNVGGLSITHDYAQNTVTANNLNGWSFTPPGPLGYYEVTGEWIPGVAFGGASTGITYGGQAGSYTWKGKNIHVEYQLSLTSKGSSTGSATVTGLPVASASSYGGNCTMNFQLNASGLTGSPLPVTGPSTTTITLRQSGATGSADVTNSNFTNTTQLIGSCDYLNAL